VTVMNIEDIAYFLGGVVVAGLLAALTQGVNLWLLNGRGMHIRVHFRREEDDG